MDQKWLRRLPILALGLVWALTVAADSGQVTAFKLWYSWNPPLQNGFIQAPFYFADRVYAVSNTTYGDFNKLLFSVGRLGESGQYIHDSQFHMPIDGAARRYSSCVFRGEVFLFHEKPTGVDEFEIRYHRSTSPAVSWTPGTPEGFRAGDHTGKYWTYKMYKHTGLKAVVFNDRIYLLYYRDGYLHTMTSTNGTDWVRQGTIGLAGDQMQAQFGACVTTRSNKPVICIAVAGSAKKLWDLQWFYLDDKGNVEVGPSRNMYWTYMHVENCISLAAGSLPESNENKLQEHAVQVFGQYSGAWPWEIHTLRRTAMDVETSKEAGMDVMDIAAVNRWYQIIPCDALEIALPAPAKDKPNPGDFRKYILVFTMGSWGTEAQYVGVASYESSYFEADQDRKYFSSAAGHTQDYRAYWTLLGVIEGMPPFTRNGNKPGPSLSEVEYGRSEEKTWTTETTWEGSVVLSPGFKQYGIEVSGSVKYLFNATAGLTTELKSSFATTFKTMAANADGSLGYLLYAKPTFSSRRFSELSQNRKNRLGDYTVLSVSHLDIGYDTYALSAPPPGMTPRAPATDLRYWKESRGSDFYREYPGLTRRTYNAMEISSSTDARCTFSQTEKRTAKNMNGVELGLTTKFKEGLGVDFGSSFAVKIGTSWQSSFNEYVTAKLSPIPEKARPDAPAVEKLIVKSAWYVAEPDRLLPSITPRPPWVPDVHARQGLIPWCMTWLVLDSIPPGVYPTPGLVDASPQWNTTGGESADVLGFPADEPGCDRELRVLWNGVGDCREPVVYSYDGCLTKLFRLGHFSVERQSFTVLAEDLVEKSLGLMLVPGEGELVFVPLEDAALPDELRPVVYGDVFEVDGSCIVVQDETNGSLWLWELDPGATRVASKEELLHDPGPGLVLVGRGDFNGDGELDLLLRDDASGAFRIWMNGQADDAALTTLDDARLADLTLAGVGQLDENGHSDLLLHDRDGKLVVCLIKDGAVLAVGGVESGSRVSHGAAVLEVADLDGDGISDIAIRDWEGSGTIGRAETYRIEYLEPLPVPESGLGDLARVKGRQYSGLRCPIAPGGDVFIRESSMGRTPRASGSKVAES